MYSKRLSQIDALGNGVVSLASGTPTALNPTNHALQVGDGTTLTSLAVGSTGTVLIGSSAANPAFGSSIDGDITLTSSTSGTTRTLLIDNTSNSASASAVVQARVAGALAGDPRLLLSIQGTTDWCVKSNNVGSREYIVAHSTSGTTAQYQLIDTTGNVTTPSNSSVIAYNSAGTTSVTGDGTAVTVTLDSELADANGNFASNTFTAPVTSRYQANVAIGLIGLTASHNACLIQLVTSNRTWLLWDFNVGAMRDVGNNLVLNCAVLVDMDANDTMTFNLDVIGGAKVVGYQGITGGQIRTSIGIINT